MSRTVSDGKEAHSPQYELRVQPLGQTAGSLGEIATATARVWVGGRVSAPSSAVRVKNVSTCRAVSGKKRAHCSQYALCVQR